MPQLPQMRTGTEYLPRAIADAFALYWRRKEGRSEREHELAMMREKIQAQAGLTEQQKQDEMALLERRFEMGTETATTEFERGAPEREAGIALKGAQAAALGREPTAPGEDFKTKEREAANWTNLRIQGEDKIVEVLTNGDMPYLQFKRAFPGAKMLTPEQYKNARTEANKEEFYNYVLSAAGQWMVSQARTMGYEKSTAFERLPNEYLTEYSLEGKFTSTGYSPTAYSFAADEIGEFVKKATGKESMMKAGAGFGLIGDIKKAAGYTGIEGPFGTKEAIAEPPVESILEKKRRLEKEQRRKIDWRELFNR